MLYLVRVLVLSGWMMSTVSEVRADWLTVPIVVLVSTTVDTLKMLESGARPHHQQHHHQQVSFEIFFLKAHAGVSNFTDYHK